MTGVIRSRTGWPILLCILVLMLSLATGWVSALPGDLSVEMTISEDRLEAAPQEAADSVTFHGNVTFTQPRYQYASASLTAVLDRNWTVSVSPTTLSSRGSSTRTFTVTVEVPPSAKGRDVAGLLVDCEYSTRFTDPQTTSDAASVAVRSWFGYRINATGPLELIVPQGSTSKLLVPVRNVGNEPDYFSGDAPYWYGLQSVGLEVTSPSSTLVREKTEVLLEFPVRAMPQAVPRAYQFDVVVDAQSLPSGGEGAEMDPRTVTAQVLVTGEMPLDSPYAAWNRGEPPEAIPAWQSVFGSQERRHNPDVDAAGRNIVFDQEVGGERSIYIADATGSTSRQLTRGHQDHHPVFSPNGQMIAFARSPDRILVMDTNGTVLMEYGTSLEVTRITDWSPSGDRLLMDAGGDIYELTLKTNTTRLLAGEPVEQWGAVYSPDGGQIYYISYEAAGRRPEVYSMTSDGARHTQLTFNDLAERFVSPSPNGKRVAFALEEATASGDRVCVMDPDGGNVRYFTDQTHSVYLLRWLPDGKGLLAEVSSGGTGTSDIQRITYPWRDAGFPDEEPDDDGGPGGGGWADIPIVSELLHPGSLLFILLVVVVVLALYVRGKRGRAARSEAAERLREATGIKRGTPDEGEPGMPRPPIRPHEAKPILVDLV